MGEAETIKEFLVGLGFSIDSASLAKFNKSISAAVTKVAALATGMTASAGAIVAGISEVSKGFEQMGYEYHLIAPAINRALLLRQELLKSYRLAGINIGNVIRSSIKLNLSLAKTRFAFEAIYKSVASRFFESITKQSDLFRKKIYENMPKIQRTLENVVQFIFKFVGAVSQLVGRLIDLDKATDGWSTKILLALAAITAAWKIFNLAFLLSGPGLVLLGIAAALTLILGIFDDFKVWKNGGKSLFNWGPFIPVMNSVADAAKSVWKVLVGVAEVLGDIFLAVSDLLTGDFSGAWDELGAAGQKIIDGFLGVPEFLLKISGAFESISNWIMRIIGLTPQLKSATDAASDAATNANTATTSQGGFASLASAGLRAALGIGSGSNISNNSRTLQQQTSVVINGAADAGDSADKVGRVMQKNNQDASRNMGTNQRPGGMIPE
jgi:hypothetical protein